MKKIFKTLLSLLILLPLLVLVKTPVLASDFTVTCAQEGPCDINFSTAPNISELFFEENILPGDSFTQTITFINEDSGYNCPLTLEAKNPTQTPADFATQLITYIRDHDTSAYLYGETGNTLDDLYGAGVISMGNIPASGTKYFDWTVIFNPLAGNEYQNAQTVFDFDLVFSCGAPAPSPSPSSVPGSPTPGSPTPGSPTPSSPEPGTSPSPTPGPASFIFEGVGGFLADVLGIGEEPSPSPEPQIAGIEENIPEVKGEATCNWWYYLWWLPLVAQACLTFLYYHWLKDKQVTAWWLVPVLLAAISQIIHEILGCECVESRLCPWYWLFNLIILVNLTVYYLWRRQKKSSDLIEE